MPPADEMLVREAFAKADLDVRSVNVVDPSGEAVFEIATGGTRYYAKILQDWKGRSLAEVLEQGVDTKLPPSRLVRGEAYVLITERAPGRPLSMALPVCFLPGIWRLVQSSLSESMYEVGVGLGTLHDATALEAGPPDDDACRIADRLYVSDVVSDHFEPDTVEVIEAALRSVRGVTLPRAKIHGDPTPHNVFWDRRSGDVSIIDFNMHPSVALEDVVVFEAGLELMAGRLPYGRASQARTLIESFRSGYLSTGVHESIPIDAVRRLKLAHFCRLLQEYLGSTAASIGECLTRRTDRPVLKRRITELIAGSAG